MCHQDGCMRTFSRYYSYIRHLTNEHPGRNTPQISISNNNNNNSLLAQNDSDTGDDLEEGTIAVSAENSHSALKEQFDEHGICVEAALCIAKLRASSSMTMSGVSAVTENVSCMVSNIVDHLKTITISALDQAQQSSADIPTIKKNIEDTFTSFSNPFVGLQSQYCEQKYFTSMGTFLQPEEIVLGHRQDQVTNSKTGNVNQVWVKDVYYYVPLKGMLKLFLESPGVWDAVQSYIPKADCVLRDFHDGEYYNSHNLLPTENCISIGLYNDDMETANPLGTHATVHKLGFFYYIVKNLPPVFNSSLNNCFLMQVYYSGDRKTYGFEKLLQRAILELKELADFGVEVLVQGQIQKVKVVLGQISGDNLGMHGLFGFVESFVANFPCRFCELPRREFHLKFTEQRLLIRNRVTHTAHVETLKTDATEVSRSGVVSDSVFNKLPYFHVTENYTPDVMHDLLEGVCPYEIKLILSVLVFEKKYLSLDILNDRIRNFNYGHASQNSKPIEISAKVLNSSDGVLKQSASEMWTLTQYLPLMIGDKIPEKDQHWRLLLSLLECMSIIFAPAINREATYYLQQLITDHLELFVEVFPEERVKPKQHFLVHYPRCIRLVGPLIRFWCMRFEAKHNFFRRLSHIVSNFRNICKTMAYRHQWNVCYRMYSKEPIDARSLEVGSGVVQLLANHDQGKIIAQNLHMGLFEEVFQANWIKVHGVEYRRGLSVVFCVDNESCLPVFGYILSVFVVEGMAYLFLEKWLSTYFDDHLFAYCVVQSSPYETCVIEPTELIDFHPVMITGSYGDDNRQYFERQASAKKLLSSSSALPSSTATSSSSTPKSAKSPSPSTSTPCRTVADQSNPPVGHSANIHELLTEPSNRVRGFQIIKDYDTLGELPRRSRTWLVSIVVEQGLIKRHGTHPKSSEKEELANAILEAFPNLHDGSQTGYVEEDFYQLFPNASPRLVTYWDKVAIKVIDLVKRDSKDPHIKNMLELLALETQFAGEIFSKTKLFCAALVQIGTSVAEYAADRKKQCQQHGITWQPQVLALGRNVLNIEQVFILMNDVLRRVAFTSNRGIGALISCKHRKTGDVLGQVAIKVIDLVKRDSKDPHIKNMLELLALETQFAGATDCYLMPVNPIHSRLNIQHGAAAIPGSFPHFRYHTQWNKNWCQKDLEGQPCMNVIGTSVAEYAADRKKQCQQHGITWQPQVLALGRNVLNIEQVFILMNDGYTPSLPQSRQLTSVSKCPGLQH
ncbi:hypothetical protein GQR58_016758 [Nymphon striatum]|nr:hypothetical protein GQR58_016758 [Nymphon striatum]